MTVISRHKIIASEGGSSSSSGGVSSIVAGNNITVNDTDPNNPIISATADDIIVVANYSALPAVNTVSGKFYWASASQGSKWWPGSLGGTYYNSGLYYSNGVTWENVETPYQATQSEVNAGTNTDKFVTSSSLFNSTQWATKQPVGTYATGTGIANGTNTGDETAPRIALINHATSSKAVLVDADELTGQDSATAFSLIRTTLLNVWTYISKKFESKTNGGNANYSILAGDNVIITGTTLTAARVWTLPSASSVNSGNQKVVADFLQTITAYNTITIGVQTGEYLNGVLNGTEIMATHGGQRRFISNGTNGWAFDKDVVRLNVHGSTLIIYLGTVEYFVLFTNNGAVTNTGSSILTGNIGSDLGVISGFGTSTVTGTFYNANSITAQVKVDLLNVYNQLVSLPVTNSVHAAAFGGSETLTTGVYSVIGAGSLSGNLILDGLGDASSIFVFKFGGAFSTAASSSVTLINGAKAGNVFWVADGVISMAASTTMKGTLIANNAAISMASSGNLEGRMFSTAGAITYGPGTGYTPSSAAPEPISSAILSIINHNSPLKANIVDGDEVNGQDSASSFTLFRTTWLNVWTYISAKVSSTVMTLTNKTLTSPIVSGLEIIEQATPSTPTNSIRLYADPSNRFSWIGENGFTRTFDGTSNTANRMYTLQDKSGIIAHLDDITGASNLPLTDAISQLNNPPAHVAGQRYLVNTAPTGAWVGFANNIAESNGTTWTFTAPILNNTVYLTSVALTYKYNGTLWVQGGAVPILQNGNSLGIPLSIGTNDSFDLILKRNNVQKASATSTGFAVRNAANTFQSEFQSAVTANRTITLPDGNLTITGGGTIALGTFTATFPGTGTVTLGSPGASGRVFVGTSATAGAGSTTLTYVSNSLTNNVSVNSDTTIVTSNINTGVSARAIFQATNGTYSAVLSQYGSAYAAAGLLVANLSSFQSSSIVGILYSSTSVSTFHKWTIGGNSAINEYMDLSTGLLSVKQSAIKMVSTTANANNVVTNNKILKVDTTNATVTELTTDGAAGSGATNRISVPTNSMMSVVLNVACKQSGSSVSKQFLRQFRVINNGGVTTVGTVTVLGTDDGDAALVTAAITISANDTDDCLRIDATGVAATSLRWTAFVVSTEVVY